MRTTGVVGSFRRMGRRGKAGTEEPVKRLTGRDYGKLDNDSVNWEDPAACTDCAKIRGNDQEQAGK